MPKPKCPMCHRECLQTQPPNILQTALNVHMTATGSFERSAADQAADVKVLTDKLQNWTDYGDRPFDAAVRQVVQVALAEAGELRRRTYREVAKNIEG